MVYRLRHWTHDQAVMSSAPGEVTTLVAGWVTVCGQVNYLGT